jgi:TolB-like protein
VTLTTRASNIRFGPFELDLRTGTFRKHGVKIRLQPQSLQILMLLLKHPGEIITREEIRQQLWPADTFVDFDHGLNVAIRKLRCAFGDSATKRRYIETHPKLGYRLAVPIEDIEYRRIEAIAVLPFVNLGDSTADDYFADGIADELISILSKIRSLRVISRTSAMHYRRSRKRISEISRELGVDAVVEGTIQRVGAKIRINARLVDAIADTHLWAETYNGEVGDVLFLQSALASAIATAIKGQLTAQERATLAKAQRVVPGAYEAYLRGRHAWGRGTAANLATAARHFEDAIEQDPTYPLAYVGLADSYVVRAFYSALAPRYAYPRAKAAALKALELDAAAGEALASLANVYLNFEWDFKAAESTYTRALALSPSYATAHQWSGQLPVILGRFAEAIERVHCAQELDPLSLRISAMVGWVYYLARLYDRAKDQLQMVVEQASDFPMAHWWLGQVLRQSGAWQLAIAELERAATLFGSNICLGSLVAAYAGAGMLARANRLVAEMHEMERTTRYFPAYALAEAYVGIGDRDNAFAYLRKAYAQREPALLFIGVEPKMDSVRNDPRFAALVDEIGLSLASGA